MPKLTVFISSPGDVQFERQIARRVVARLADEFAGRAEIEPYFWEYEPMRLTADFQTQIPSTSTFDIVICILWSRLGSPLGPTHVRPDGTPYRSGTEFEFEDAANSYRARGRPDILVYRNDTDPPIKARPKEERERQLAQLDALEDFLANWTWAEGGIFKGALTRYADVAQFEDRLTDHLRRLLDTRLPAGAHSHEIRGSWTEGSPFRGLQAFQAEHAAVFRGRIHAVQDVIGLVRRQRLARSAFAIGEAESVPPLFVTVFAMSGIGKSSLIRAGVLPILTSPGVLEGVGLWRRAIMRPGPGPDLVNALAETLTGEGALPEILADGTAQAEFAGLLRQRPAAADGVVKGALSQAAAQLLTDEQAALDALEVRCVAEKRDADVQRCRAQRSALVQRGASLVLFIDQFEELFTATALPASERDAFLAVLDELARGGRVVVIATLRSDFVPRLTDMPVLTRLAQEGALYQLAPPTPVELAQMIRDPAREAGLVFEQQDSGTGARLDDLLLAATQDDPASLPLLEFMLDQLFEQRGPEGLLTHAAYDALGGLQGAIASRAETEYSALPPAAQQAFPGLCGILVNVSTVRDEERPVRRQARMSEVEAVPGGRDLVDRFLAARLLVASDAGGETGISVAHEALFSHWNRLSAWIDLNRDLLRIRDRVESAAAHWVSSKRPRDLLLTEGRLLAEADDLGTRGGGVVLSRDTQDFVAASRGRARFRRRRNLALAAGVAATVSLSIAGYFIELGASRRNALEAKLIAYRDATRNTEQDFYAKPYSWNIEASLQAIQNVFRLRDAIKAMRGTPPETANRDTARLLQYAAILHNAQGKTDTAKQDLLLSHQLLADQLQTEGARTPQDTVPNIDVNVVTVLELHAELTMYKNYLVKTFNDKAKSGTPVPKEFEGEETDQYLLAEDKGDVRELSGIEALLLFTSYRDEHDLLNRMQKLEAEDLVELQDWDGAKAAWLRRVETAEKALAASMRGTDKTKSSADQDEGAAKSPSEPSTEQAGLASAAEDAHVDFLNFLMDRKDKAGIIQEAKALVDFLVLWPSSGSSAQRFETESILAETLKETGQADTGSGLMVDAVHTYVAVEQQRVDETWAGLADSQKTIARQWNTFGDHAKAADAAEHYLELSEAAMRSPPVTPDKGRLAAAYEMASWYELLAGRFDKALVDVDRGAALDPGGPAAGAFAINKAHALLLSGRVHDARVLYTAYVGKFDPDQDGEAKRFGDEVLEDFDTLKAAGFTTPAMDGIRRDVQGVLERLKADHKP